MLLYSLAIVAGLLLLVWGADRFVFGAAVTARTLGVAPMLIGLTIVGFATSAPEMVVSATAAAQGVPGIAMGNALGSNIANIALVLGATAIVRPLVVGSVTLQRETALLMAVTVLTLMLLLDLSLSRLDALLLAGGLVLFVIWMLKLGYASRDSVEAEYAAEIRADVGLFVSLGWLVAGLAVLLAGSALLVWGGENLARELGVSDLVIGATIVAVGTSLPELAVCVMSARKGEQGMALGNIVGSNVFNLLAVLGIAAMVQPFSFGEEVVLVHYRVMTIFTVALFLMAYNYLGRGINRLSGALLLVGFCAYQAYITLNAGAAAG